MRVTTLITLILLFQTMSLHAYDNELVKNLIKTVKPLNDMDTIVLIGFDTTDNISEIISYGKMYDAGANTEFDNFQPFTTIGIIREGDQIEVESAPYLAAPTSTGFKYINLKNSNKLLTVNDMDLPPDVYEGIKYNNNDIEIFITSNKNEIIETLNQNFEDGDAINTINETIDYITSGFYIKRGYSSTINFGASWFNAVEFSELVTFKNKYPKKLSELIPHESYILTLKKVFEKVYGYYPENNDLFPWGDSIATKDDGVFSIYRDKGQLNLLALIPCWGNSSRNFLAPLEIGEVPDVLLKHRDVQLSFDRLKQLNPEIQDIIVSSNRASVFILTSSEVYCYDTNTGNIIKTINLLEQFPNGHANKIIMVESTIGKDVPLWKSVLKYRD